MLTPEEREALKTAINIAKSYAMLKVGDENLTKQANRDAAALQSLFDRLAGDGASLEQDGITDHCMPVHKASWNDKSTSPSASDGENE